VKGYLAYYFLIAEPEIRKDAFKGRMSTLFKGRTERTNSGEFPLTISAIKQSPHKTGVHETETASLSHNLKTMTSRHLIAPTKSYALVLSTSFDV